MGSPLEVPQVWFDYQGGAEESGPGRILLIARDHGLLQTLDTGLTEAGYVVLSALNGGGAVAACRAYRPSLVVVDLLMEGSPGGMDTCRKIRTSPKTASIPLLLLISKTGPDLAPIPDLESECSITVPFAVDDLLARVRTILAKPRPTVEDHGNDRELRIDVGRRNIHAAGRPVQLTEMEFDLLRALAQARGNVVTREILLAAVRGRTPEAVGRSVDVHLSAVRRKLGDLGDLVETVRGVGYRLRTDEGAPE